MRFSCFTTAALLLARQAMAFYPIQFEGKGKFTLDVKKVWLIGLFFFFFFFSASISDTSCR